MPLPPLDRGVLAAGALLYLGAAVLAGILINGLPGRRQRPRRSADELSDYDDPGIPLRFAAGRFGSSGR